MTEESNRLRIIPLGGLGEVGKNMMLYQWDEDILVVDTGIMFPENDLLGVDYIIPDLTYLVQHRHQVKGIVITHGHDDHTGAIRHVLDVIQVPIYATSLTRGLLEVKLAKGGMAQKAEFVTVQAGQTVEIGCFSVEFFHVCHSIPDCVGLGIKTPAGLVIHTGDYKFDQTPVDNWPTDFAKLAEFSSRGVLALLADSTNAERSGWTPSERVVDAALDQVFKEAKGRIIVASFASLISRMQQVATATYRHARKMSFVGMSMLDNAKIARKLGYLTIADALLLPLDRAKTMPDNEIVLMCTGAQGEPTSILGQLSRGAHKHFEIKAGDTVILSSHAIPGNEEAVYRTINQLVLRGADVVYEDIAPVHVSGHASEEEMKLMLNLLRPKYFIPVHGEPRHLKQHAKIARQVGIPAENIAVIENGQIIDFIDGKMQLGDKVPTGRAYVSGSAVVALTPGVIREREKLAEDGAVWISLLIDPATNKLLQDAQVSSYGCLSTVEIKDALFAKAKQRIHEIIDAATGDFKKEVEQAVRSTFHAETGCKPLVFVNIITLESSG